MAFNGSGTFQRLYSWVNDAAANIKIRADRMDNEMNGMATGLSTCITKDGQTTVTANLPMAGFIHTGVGDGTARTNYASVGQAQDGKLNWVAAGGTADAITAVYAIAVTAVADGQLFYVRAGAANATTTPTFSPSGLTARTIVKNGGSALGIGDISGSGHEMILRYNLANTRYELLNPAITVSTVTDATISTSDITTNNASTAKHGWLKKLSNVATEYMDGTGAWSVPPVTTDATLTTTDITTNNASTSKHGFLKKLDNTATNYMDGTGAWSVPAGTPGGLTTIASGSFGAVTLVDITSIPATYRGLVLYISGASNTVATRALQIEVSTGSAFGSSTHGSRYKQIAGTTITDASGAPGSGGARLWTDVTQTAAQTTHARIIFHAYQSGPIKAYEAKVAAAATGASWATGTEIFSNGFLTDTSAGDTPRTGAISGIRITWDNVATGVFDGGTYALYGVN